MPTPYSGTNVYPTSYDIPSDGDARDAASVNVGLEALGDRTTYLYNHLPAQIVFTRSFNTTGDPTTIETIDNNVVANAWTKTVNVLLNVGLCESSDTLFCYLVSGVSLPAGSYTCNYRIYATDDVSGTPTDHVVLGSTGSTTKTAAGTSGSAFFMSMGTHIVTANGTTRIGLEIRPTVAGAWTLDVLTGSYIRVERLRA